MGGFKQKKAYERSLRRGGSERGRRERTEERKLAQEKREEGRKRGKEGKRKRGKGKKGIEKGVTDGVDPESYVKENNLAQITDLSAIRPVLEEVIAANEKSVSEYKAGKTHAMGYIMGQAMRALKGKAPAQEVQKLLHELLD